MSNRTSNVKKKSPDAKTGRSWQQIVFIGISVILILAWMLSLVKF